jgi:NAD(P)-dependent dehydrogenase (short-subunit alcohol dehydrogenase family)
MSFLAAFIYRQFIYIPPVPAASFAEQTAIITGSSSGLGLEIYRWIVRFGAKRVIQPTAGEAANVERNLQLLDERKLKLRTEFAKTLESELFVVEPIPSY